MHEVAYLALVALKDYIHDRRYGLVSALILTSVLAPILVLFGIKNGIVEEMFARLRSDPTAVEIRPLGQGQYDDVFFANLQKKDEVSYLIAATRFLSSTVELKNQKNLRVPPLSGELVPTSAGDPLWGKEPKWDDEGVEVALSTTLSEKLKLKVGDNLRGRVGRFVDGKRQVADIKFIVSGIIPLSLNAKDIVLVPLSFLVATEDYREGGKSDLSGFSGEKEIRKGRTFASFRLYAQKLEDVAALRTFLVEQNVETKTALARINLIQTLDQVLSSIFWIITGLATFGYLLAASVQSSLVVIRKAPDLAVLKLLGFSSQQVSLFPVFQSLLTGLIGSTGAVLTYYVAQVFINELVSRLEMIEGVVASLPLGSALSAIGLTICICLVTSFFGGRRTSKIYPSEGLRND